ncbi:MAG: hypothetical protein M3Y48_15650 [Actinomycetota bacterium]|nr:hypothetical protein [Actinomycetota bacterium]
MTDKPLALRYRRTPSTVAKAVVKLDEKSVAVVTEGDNPGGEAMGEAPEMTGSSPRCLPGPASPA